MRIYVAHSFEGNDFAACRLANDPDCSSFLNRLKKQNVEVIDPASSLISRTLPGDRFKYCLNAVASADAVVVLARSRLGIGVGAEMMYAHMHDIRVYVVCPMDSYYRTLYEGEAVIHSFVYGLSTEVFCTLDACADAIENLVSSRVMP
jgi:hypothetical protein